MDSNVQLLVSMMKSQADYISPRIENKKDRDYYRELVSEILGTIHKCSDWNQELPEVSMHVHNTFNVIKSEAQIPWYSFERSREKYAWLAINNTKDILKSIETRFITGGSSFHDIW